MAEITFMPINEISIDLVAVIYDFLLACLTGYIVWFKTDEYMLRREEREAFRREQQEYSRYLGRLCLMLKSFKQPDETIRYTIEDLLENAPSGNLSCSQMINAPNSLIRSIFASDQSRHA